MKWSVIVKVVGWKRGHSRFCKCMLADPTFLRRTNKAVPSTLEARAQKKARA